MFYGEYDHSLDKKGRIILPSKFRIAMKEHYVEKLFLTRGLDECVFVFPEEEWKSQEARFRAIPFTKREGRKFNRLYFSGAVDAVVDKQGRILVPRYLKDYAKIKREVVILGVSNRIEIWSKEKWEEFYRTSKESFEDVAEKLVNLD
ncbi:MAG: division/cell wall cluster transcriptional repressor MraZ [Candidatus Omnitrophica bacterium]|nr:division/cell wall cluster transcriptional repressor MraZ [Candidatus Omnitrophota bacterium]